MLVKARRTFGFDMLARVRRAERRSASAVQGSNEQNEPVFTRRSR